MVIRQSTTLGHTQLSVPCSTDGRMFYQNGQSNWVFIAFQISPNLSLTDWRRVGQTEAIWIQWSPTDPDCLHWGVLKTAPIIYAHPSNQSCHMAAAMSQRQQSAVYHTKFLLKHNKRDNVCLGNCLMSQPYGDGIGANLEAKDHLKQCRPSLPPNTERCLMAHSLLRRYFQAYILHVSWDRFLALYCLYAIIITVIRWDMFLALSYL